MPTLIRITMTGQTTYGKDTEPSNLEPIRVEGTGHSYEDAVEACLKKLREKTNG